MEPVVLSAFKYSIAKILFGDERTFADFLILFKYIKRAFSLALGKEIPFDNSCASKDLNSSGSSHKISANSLSTDISSVSQPKEIASTIFNELEF